MEGSTNISGGIKQMITGADSVIGVYASETYGEYFSASINDWTNVAPFAKFKVNGTVNEFWYSSHWNWGSYTPTITTDAGFRVVRIRNGVTTVLNQRIFNFTSGVATAANSSYAVTTSLSSIAVFNGDILALQLKYPTGLQTGAGIGIGLDPPTNGARSGYIYFTQNTMFTSTL